jgi:hypothetical protein
MIPMISNTNQDKPKYTLFGAKKDNEEFKMIGHYNSYKELQEAEKELKHKRFIYNPSK